MEGESSGDSHYKNATGCLMWLATMTRPDITNAVRVVMRPEALVPSERTALAGGADYH